jgi:hypothetical protein
MPAFLCLQAEEIHQRTLIAKSPGAEVWKAILLNNETIKNLGTSSAVYKIVTISNTSTPYVNLLEGFHLLLDSLRSFQQEVSLMHMLRDCDNIVKVMRIYSTYPEYK